VYVTNILTFISFLYRLVGMLSLTTHSLDIFGLNYFLLKDRTSFTRTQKNGQNYSSWVWKFMFSSLRRKGKKLWTE